MTQRDWPAPLRLGWRIARNAMCAIPGGSSILFPREELASEFGPDSVSYAWRVYARHRNNLLRCGFQHAASVLEVGPGRNTGSSLLWWCDAVSTVGHSPRVVLWDAFRNANIDAEDYWRIRARSLVEAAPSDLDDSSRRLVRVLCDVEQGVASPDITYLVGPLSEFLEKTKRETFSLVYSHATLEHVWDIEKLWKALASRTAPGGWQSHRIDLADHGRRDANYLEMLETPDWLYWSSMRFIPGAVNRWRACDHVAEISGCGFTALLVERELHATPPARRARLSGRFRAMPEDELRTTALDLVARKNDGQ